MLCLPWSPRYEASQASHIAATSHPKSKFGDLIIILVNMLNTALIHILIK